MEIDTFYDKKCLWPTNDPSLWLAAMQQSVLLSGAMHRSEGGLATL